MRWSYRVARIAGIDISIHITFLLIVLLFAVQWGSIHGIVGAFFGVALVLLLFLCVLLHELGHSLAAQRLGIGVQQIMLLPLGGVALLSRTVTRPLHELLIALAGPLVNVLLAILIGAVLAATGNLLLLGSSAMVQGLDVDLTWQTLLLWLFEANILLVVFNMIPALPLDGGRVLRSVLAMATDFRRATQIAAVLGQGIAVALGLYALLGGNFFLLLIAVFIFLGAGQERSASQASVMLSSHRVSDAYNKHALTLTIGDRVSNVLDYIMTGYQPAFAVLQESRLLGIITRDDVLELLRTAPDQANVLDVYVTTVMRREVVRVDVGQTLDDALQVMGASNVRVVAVFDEAQYVGLLNRDDLAEAYTVLTFMERLQRVPTA